MENPNSTSWHRWCADQYLRPMSSGLVAVAQLSVDEWTGRSRGVRAGFAVFSPVVSGSPWRKVKTWTKVGGSLNCGSVRSHGSVGTFVDSCTGASETS